MTKSVQVSSDGGTTYFTLPGNNGEFINDAGSLDDTVFGQNFKSNQPNLIGWSVNAPAFYKGFAGYTTTIKKQGSATATTGEAMSVVTGQEYAIDDAAKNIWDRSATITVYDNGSDVTSNVATFDYLFGRITFESGYSVTGPVTVDVTYFPATALSRYRGFTLTMSQESIDTTDMPATQANSGHMTYDYGLKTVGIELTGVYNVANGYRASLVAREELIIEIDPGGTGKTVFRGFFKPSSQRQSGAVGALEEENATFELFVPGIDNLTRPFGFEFNNTDLSTAVQKVLEAFDAETILDVDYTSDGTTGLRGDTIVADVSLSGGTEAMNEFNVRLQGTGIVTAY